MKSKTKNKKLMLPAPIPDGWLMVLDGYSRVGDKYFNPDNRKFYKAPPDYKYDNFACLIRKDPKDYKKLYENLSKRIGRLHTVASNLTDSMHKRDMPEPGELGRLLKRIAYGQP